MGSNSLNSIKNLEKLFWDMNIRDLSPVEHGSFIIARVLEKGNCDDLRRLFEIFAVVQIKSVVMNSYNLSNRTAFFWSKMLDIAPQKIKCLQNQSRIRQLPF